MSGDYKVGYGKPPVHTRFQKGRSGNPGGRPGPKKARRRLFAQLLEDRLLEPPEVVAMTRCKTGFAGMARGMALDVVRGKPATMRMAFALLDELDRDTKGRRRPRTIDQILEQAEREEAAESFRDEDAAGSPVPQRIIEESPRMRGENGR